MDFRASRSQACSSNPQTGYKSASPPNISRFPSKTTAFVSCSFSVKNKFQDLKFNYAGINYLN